VGSAPKGKKANKSSNSGCFPTRKVSRVTHRVERPARDTSNDESDSVWGRRGGVWAT
jgi:hypothetical protein